MLRMIEGHVEDRRVLVDGQELDPAWSQKVNNHSPNGFMWGYPGSGPAQLALALMLLVVDKPSKAHAIHQQFKEDYVARWNMDNDFKVLLDLEQIAEGYLAKVPENRRLWEFPEGNELDGWTFEEGGDVEETETSPIEETEDPPLWATYEVEPLDPDLGVDPEE